MKTKARLRQAFDQLLNEGEGALASLVLVRAFGGDVVLPGQRPLDDVLEEHRDDLREALIELMPRESIFIDLWDWGLHFESELGDDWLQDAAIGSDDDLDDVAAPLIAYYLRKSDEYDIDPGVLTREELVEQLWEDARSFLCSWRKAVVSACLPETFARGAVDTP